MYDDDQEDDLLFQVGWQGLVAEAVLHAALVQVERVINAVDGQRVVPEVNGELTLPVQVLAHVNVVQLRRSRRETYVASHEDEELESVRVEIP